MYFCSVQLVIMQRHVLLHEYKQNGNLLIKTASPQCTFNVIKQTIYVQCSFLEYTVEEPKNKKIILLLHYDQKCIAGVLHKFLSVFSSQQWLRHSQCGPSPVKLLHQTTGTSRCPQCRATFSPRATLGRKQPESSSAPPLTPAQPLLIHYQSIMRGVIER